MSRRERHRNSYEYVPVSRERQSAHGRQSTRRPCSARGSGVGLPRACVMIAWRVSGMKHPCSGRSPNDLGPQSALWDRVSAALVMRNHPAASPGESQPGEARYALFADDAIAAIGHAARGLPRQIGNLATAALIAGYTRRNTIIDHDCATAAITDALGYWHAPPPPRRRGQPVRPPTRHRNPGTPRGLACPLTDPDTALICVRALDDRLSASHSLAGADPAQRANKRRAATGTAGADPRSQPCCIARIDAGRIAQLSIKAQSHVTATSRRMS